MRESDFDDVYLVLRENGLKACVSRIGTLNSTHAFRVTQSNKVLIDENLFDLRALWSDVTRRIQGLRDNPECAEQEHQLKLDPNNPGISPKITFDHTQLSLATKTQNTRNKESSDSGLCDLRDSVANNNPKIAILREQGVNVQIEMAAAFTRAGF